MQMQGLHWGPDGKVKEPCPVTMVTTHQEATTSPQSPTSIPSKEVAQKIKKNYRSNVVLHVSYSCVIGISAIIIFSLCIALTVLIRKANQVRKNAKTTNSQPDLEDIEYMPVRQMNIKFGNALKKQIFKSNQSS